MRRADRLFEIIQILRRATGPLTASAIADELETGKRTVYRDIGALVAQRVPIRGEAGIGYVLDRGFVLPPLMLNSDEIEAVVLGSQWVVAHGDDALARAAANVLAKVAAILPDELREVIDDPVVGTPPARTGGRDGQPDLGRLRQWCRQGRKLRIAYRDEAGDISERTVWPFMVGYIATARMLMAWCELRADFRLFRLSRLTGVSFAEDRYPERPATLRRRWLATLRSPARDDHDLTNVMSAAGCLNTGIDAGTPIGGRVAAQITPVPSRSTASK